jgi:hypothetical protein
LLAFNPIFFFKRFQNVIRTGIFNFKEHLKTFELTSKNIQQTITQFFWHLSITHDCLFITIDII